MTVPLETSITELRARRCGSPSTVKVTCRDRTSWLHEPFFTSRLRQFFHRRRHCTHPTRSATASQACQRKRECTLHKRGRHLAPPPASQAHLFAFLRAQFRSDQRPALVTMLFHQLSQPLILLHEVNAVTRETNVRRRRRQKAWSGAPRCRRRRRRATK